MYENLGVATVPLPSAATPMGELLTFGCCINEHFFFGTLGVELLTK